METTLTSEEIDKQVNKNPVSFLKILNAKPKETTKVLKLIKNCSQDDITMTHNNYLV